jgi:hypothetical protein
MSAKLEEQRREAPRGDGAGEREGGPLEAAVCGSVLSELGRPPGPHRVQVRLVWGGRYRVNVFVGVDTPSPRVAHSFFLQADGDGKVLTSSPAITRAY